MVSRPIISGCERPSCSGLVGTSLTVKHFRAEELVAYGHAPMLFSGDQMRRR